ncbi:5' nucleotidase, NT5C type [Mucilaginibacter aquaedulcis]|jgi:5'-nucleotidase|uniref:5' nucleotidase, NT5C type n=1 Tax=Mucilaginibacter aquaedulcis TaxID=1187081 RepID=UPI0025B5895E|nr:5'(3')-deoxyribonucleotidase [Mucilaginibacter aquaedulcis]MDN3551065.1 5'(3')-deoxyribonucleotidase [Mucilaginibacter aquaedulcis]
MKTLKRIAVDMDGVLADTDTHFLAWYYNVYGVQIPYEQILGKPEGEGFPEKDACRKFAFTPGFFRTLPVMPGAVEAITELMKDFEIYIVSAAMEFPQSLPEKYEWLKEHFPFIPWTHIVFCGDKSLINTDYMIDDHPKNLDKFKGTTIMFNAAHNTNIDHHQRVNSWTEVLALLKSEKSLVTEQ